MSSSSSNGNHHHHATRQQELLPSKESANSTKNIHSDSDSSEQSQKPPSKVLPKDDSKNTGPLENMKDLDHALDQILVNLPKNKLTSGYSHLSQKTFTASTMVQPPQDSCELPLLKTLSKEYKEKNLKEITPLALNLSHHVNVSGVKAAVVLCKFIQCVLWDVGFQYVLLSYQFDAVLASAGIHVKELLDVLANWDGQSRALLVCLNERGREARVGFCRDAVSFVGTKGLLLAGKCGCLD
jgi:hypothetical protein